MEGAKTRSEGAVVAVPVINRGAKVRPILPKERPILFSAPMVLALLDKRKTQTRRTVKGMPEPPAPSCHERHTQKHPAPYFDSYRGDEKTAENPGRMSENWCWWQVDDRQCLPTIKCPYGKPGDLLWVREAWRLGEQLDVFNATEIAARANDVGYMKGPYGPVWYPANDAYRQWGNFDKLDFGNPGRRRHARFMPRWASRITLRITNIRVERVQDISGKDARAEGFPYHPFDSSPLACLDPVDWYSALWESINGKGSWECNDWVWVIGFELVEPA